MRRVHGSRHSARFVSHLVVRTHPDVSFHYYFQHGSGAFVLTCGCCWVMVSMEYATGQTSGYWYCGEVTQTWPLRMRLQEMDPRLLKRPSSTRCNCWNGSAQETREWKTSRTAQVEAVARAGDTAGNNDTRGSEIKRELGSHETRDKAKRFLCRKRWTRTMENVVFHDESIPCSSCHKSALHPERVVG